MNRWAIVSEMGHERPISRGSGRTFHFPTTRPSSVKTLRFHLPVLATDDEADFLDLVTRVPGVVAAVVDEDAAWLDVALSSEATGLLVKRAVQDALLAGMRAVEA